MSENILNLAKKKPAASASASSIGRVGSGGAKNVAKTQPKSSKSAEITKKKQPGVKSDRPSEKLNPKTINPFSGKSNSSFATLYTSGGVPCRLQHGSVKHSLSWDVPPNNIPFDPILVTLADGLRETLHPYMFVARQGFKELLEVDDARDKTIPILLKLIPLIRATLNHSDTSVFLAGCDALSQLSNVVSSHLNPHLKNLIVPLSKQLSKKDTKDTVTETLQTLEQNGGKEALTCIKGKVPTYCSIMI